MIVESFYRRAMIKKKILQVWLYNYFLFYELIIFNIYGVNLYLSFIILYNTISKQFCEIKT